jgi:hypothetical protein
MTRIAKFIHTPTRAILPLLLLSSLVNAQDSMDMSHGSPASLVQEVRNVTRQFLDVNNAGPAGYEPAFGCSLVQTMRNGDSLRQRHAGWRWQA